MKRISRKRALILARKYERIARALHLDAYAALAMPIKAELPIENARRRIAEARLRAQRLCQREGMMPTHNPTPPVNARYGAPMGRRECNQDCVGRVSLRRVPIDSGGYDRGGAYWGIGQPLYWAGDESGALDIFFRVRTRDAAKAHVRGMWSDAKFYR